MMTEKEKRAYLEGEGFTRQDFMDHEENFLVEAGAGAGKTTIMVRRIVNQLVTGYCEPEEVVAITFTKKSTLELRERLDALLVKRQEKLLEKAEKEALTEAEKKTLERLEYLIRESGRMQVSTIHSFCQTMLESMPFASPLGLDMQVMENDDAMGSEFLRRRMRQNYALFRKVRNMGMPVYMLEKFFLNRCENSEAEIQYCTDEKKLDQWLTTDIPKAAADFHKELVAVATTYAGELKTAYIHTGVYQILQMTPAELAKDEKAVMQLAWHSLNSPEKCPVQSSATDYYKKQFRESAPGKALSEVWGGKSGDALRNATAPWIHSVVMKDLDVLLREYRAEKLQQHKATFNDLLLRARDMLRDNREARTYFHGRYKVLYVDEMQDTDPVQTELLFYLTTDEAHFHAKNWKKCRPVPGSLFLVGDPKQAIYRFRGADIGVYNILLELFREDDPSGSAVGKKVTLRFNFRSTKEVCELTDKVFKPDAQNPSDVQFVGGTYHAEYVSMESQAAPCERTRLMRYFNGDPSKKMDPECVAAFIATMIANKMEVGIDDPEHDKHKHPAEARDFLVLTRGKSAPQKYANALINLGIPVDVSGENDFKGGKGGASPFERAALHLRSLLAPRDDRLVIKVLKECYALHYTHTKDEVGKDQKVKKVPVWERTVEQRVHRLLVRAGRTSLTSLLYPKPLAEIRLALEAEQAANQDVENLFLIDLVVALEELAALRQMVKTQPAMAVIEQLLEGGYGVWRGEELKSIDRRCKQYSVIQQYLNLIRKSRERSFPALATYAIECLEKHYEHDLALKPSDNVVRIMNLHKAKGLEGEVVILAYSAYKELIPKIHVVREEGKPNREFVALHPPKPDGYDRDQAVAWPEHWVKQQCSEEKKFTDAEYARLLYVAATRAKTMLVVFGDPRAGLIPMNAAAPAAPAAQTVGTPAAPTVGTAPAAQQAPAAAPIKIKDSRSYWQALLKYLDETDSDDPLYGPAFAALETGQVVFPPDPKDAEDDASPAADPADPAPVKVCELLDLGEEEKVCDREDEESDVESEEDPDFDLDDIGDYIDDEEEPAVYAVQPVDKQELLKEFADGLAASGLLAITPSRLDHEMRSEKKSPDEAEVQAASASAAQECAAPQSDEENEAVSLVSGDLAPTISAEEASEESGPFGPAWGTMVHRVMQLAIQGCRYTGESLKGYARQAVTEALRDGEVDKGQRKNLGLGEEDDDETVIAKLVPQIVEAAGFLTDPESALRKLIAGAASYPEMPFFLRAGENDPQTGELYRHLSVHIGKNAAQDKILAVEGIIDLAVLRDDVWYVVDYKTDKVKSGEDEDTYVQRLRNEYTPQITAYARVLERMEGKTRPVRKAWLCSIPLGGYLIELDIAP